jgi:DNA-binding NarL/FixJ family response regulator
MLSVLIVDDHVAVRAGLRSVLRLDPTVEVAAAVADGRSARAEFERSEVDVVVVDYVLDDCDGLVLARELKSAATPPAVILYTAHEGQQLAIAAVIAGVDAVVGKGAPADDVLRAIHAAADGGGERPDLSQEAVREASRRVAPEDLPILGMRVSGTPEDEIAEALHLPPDDLRTRIDALVAHLSRQQHIARK